MPFTCSICGEESSRICARCTKDSCDNHLCEKCLRCSDCCECEVKLSAPPRMMVHAATPDPVTAPAPGPDLEPVLPSRDPEPELPSRDPEPELPSPDPDPEPELPSPDPEPDPAPDVLPDPEPLPS